MIYKLNEKMDEQTQDILEEKRSSRKVSDSEKISEHAAVLHLVKGNIGIGVLAIPSALANAGLTLGTLGLAVIAFTTVHCMHLLGHIPHLLQDIFIKQFHMRKHL